MNEPRMLTEIVESVRREIESRNIGKNRAHWYELTWKKLITFIDNKYSGYFTEERGMEFLETLGYPFKNPKSHEKVKSRAVLMLCDYFTDNTVPVRSKNRLKHKLSVLSNVYNKFISHLKNEGLSDKTILCYSQYLRKYLLYLEKKSITSLENISKQLILEYLTYASKDDENETHYARTAHVTNSLKRFFQYLYAIGTINQDLSTCLYIKRKKPAKKISSVYTQSEVSSILNAIDRNNALGKRDYAIFLLSARLGLRSSDICNLKFENIDWEFGEVCFCQVKTHQEIRLPLFEEVGIAIIDYLKYGRPNHESKYLFLRQTLPIGKLSPGSLCSRFYVHFKKSGIIIQEGKQHGPHVLRHSLASAMLKEQISYTIIQKTLGHTSPNTTKIYAKVDTVALRKCALDVLMPTGNFEKLLHGGFRHDNEN